jgi:hypothetical protein
MEESTRPLSLAEARAHSQEWLQEILNQPKYIHHSQFNDLVRKLADRCTAESVKRGDDEDGLNKRISAASNIVRDTWYALATKEARAHWFSDEEPSDREEKKRREHLQHMVWRRYDLVRAFQEGFESKEHPSIDLDSLIEVLAEYLARPWLRHPMLDWIFVEALLCCEISGFGEAVKRDLLPGSRDLLGMNNTYWKAKGNLSVISSENFKRNLKGLMIRAAVFAAVFVAVPVAAVVVLWDTGRREAAFFTGAAYLLIVLLRYAIKGLYWLFRKQPKETDSATRAFELWQAMAQVYRITESPIINPTELREELHRTAEKGAVWPPALYSLVDRIISIDPAVWVTRPVC